MPSPPDVHGKLTAIVDPAHLESYGLAVFKQHMGEMTEAKIPGAFANARLCLPGKGDRWHPWLVGGAICGVLRAADDFQQFWYQADPRNDAAGLLHLKMKTRPLFGLHFLTLSGETHIDRAGELPRLAPTSLGSTWAPVLNLFRRVLAQVVPQMPPHRGA